jgi:4-hydroxy-3-polyprenylbenzoate decarboxylase
MKSLIVAMSGASGVIYGVRLLQELKTRNIDVHLIVSPVAEMNLQLETGIRLDALSKLATHGYDVKDLSAPISSGSFQVDGMVVVPCSTRTLSAVANGNSDNLITRAADVTLKEKRPLVLVPREMPFNVIHLRNMLFLAEIGAVILPACPAFYDQPKSIDQLVDHVVGKVMDVLRIEHNLFRRWQGNLTTT